MGGATCSASPHVIQEMGCDTVGLQEVDSRPGERSDSQQLEFLAGATGMQAVAGATIIRHDRDYGNALLTRRKILDVRRHDLSFRRFEPRGALEVDLEVAGTCMRVFVMHLGLLPFERRFQMRKVLRDPARDADGSAGRRAGRHQRMAAASAVRCAGCTACSARRRGCARFRCGRRCSRSIACGCGRAARCWSSACIEPTLSRRASDHFPVRAVVTPEAVPLRERPVS